MDEIQKAKRDGILNAVGFCIGLATLLIDVIPVIAIGAIIFCPYYAIKSLRKYRKLKELQLKSGPLGSASPQEYLHL
ncbi:MAG: hypothetical protein AUG16_01780 [Thaumarchaeota archaeon 13_1_20CM_2_39_20]|nr:MAG: hypothetical protein AUG16_01780 [Thaumarchaeota archaeon 13_1_20CM_2_39_20]